MQATQRAIGSGLKAIGELEDGRLPQGMCVYRLMQSE